MVNTNIYQGDVGEVHWLTSESSGSSTVPAFLRKTYKNVSSDSPLSQFEILPECSIHTLLFKSLNGIGTCRFQLTNLAGRHHNDSRNAIGNEKISPDNQKQQKIRKRERNVEDDTAGAAAPELGSTADECNSNKRKRKRNTEAINTPSSPSSEKDDRNEMNSKYDYNYDVDKRGKGKTKLSLSTNSSESSSSSSCSTLLKIPSRLNPARTRIQWFNNLDIIQLFITKNQQNNKKLNSLNIENPKFIILSQNRRSKAEEIQLVKRKDKYGEK